VRSRRPELTSRLLAALACASIACGGESVAPAPSGAGGGTGVGGAGGGGGGVLVPPGDPKPLPVAQWMVATVANATNDPVLPAIENGSFQLPSSGQYLGLSWKTVVPGENQSLTKANADLIYAAAKISAPPGSRIFARGDTVASFHLASGSRQPGDFYHSRKLRVPLSTASGEELVIVRALGRRNAPEIELWSSDAEIVFNVADATLPDLVVGASEPKPMGVAVLNLSSKAIAPVSARIEANADFEATEIVHPSLPMGSVSQLSFLLKPKPEAIANAGQKLTASLLIESPMLSWSYRAKLEIATVAVGARHRYTRRSKVDGSTQYASVMPPSSVSPGQKYGLILSLHGASVEAAGQAAAYAPKSWAYLVAPTNRRPFGFDWEEWGRLDAIEALDEAMATLPIDPLRVHLTGHSMGGHGSWNVGVHYAGRFGMIAPSAGWISFDLYTGAPNPPLSAPIARARAHSQTLDFVDNFAKSSVYIIHGDADDNVPVTHARQMKEKLGPIVPELGYHEQPGAGHWWDLDQNAEGADCVDWTPMLALMEKKKREALPLDFRFVSPGPWINPRHSFVTLRSAASPMQNCEVKSSSSGVEVTLTTVNVRSLVIDGAALASAGVKSIVVDGKTFAVDGSPIPVGPQNGKRPEQSGPLNQVFHRPFCYVWDDAGPAAYRDYARWLTSWWSLIGNGASCGMPMSTLTPEIKAAHNLVYLGVMAKGMPISWDAKTVHVGGKNLDAVAVAFVFPDGDKLAGYVWAAPGSEHLLFRYTPFSSRAGYPDWRVWNAAGTLATGFFDAEWKLDPTFAIGL
jgi:predicted esterase